MFRLLPGVFTYLEANFNQLMFSFAAQMLIYTTTGYVLLGMFSVETIPFHLPLTLAAVAASLSIRINFVYLNEMLRQRGPSRSINLFFYKTDIIGRTTRRRFLGFIILASVLSFFELMPYSYKVSMNYFMADNEYVFLFRWVSLLIVFNAIVTAVGKYVSMRENVKSSNFFSHAMFASIFIGFISLFCIESEFLRVVAAVGFSYGTLILNRIHDVLASSLKKAHKKVFILA